jgi:hypothetical protein
MVLVSVARRYLERAFKAARKCGGTKALRKRLEAVIFLNF